MDEKAIKELSFLMLACGVKTEVNCVLAPQTGFKIGGPCDIAVRPNDAEGFCAALDILHRASIPFITVGRATNILFDDAGYRGAVVFTSGINGMKTEGNKIIAGCGVPLTMLAGFAAKNSLSGLEFAYGIPGSVGGGVYMNAGAYGGQISDVLCSCLVADSESGELIRMSAEDLRFSYRHSKLMDEKRYAVAEAEFMLRPGKREEIEAADADLMERRVSKQPLEYPSAGSVFKRPKPDVFMGKLIEDEGLKGFTIGGAQISQKHAGFIINTGNATSADVKAVVKHVQNVIEEKYGFIPEREVIYVPEDPADESR